MHRYRTHNCGELSPEHTGQTVRLSGWVHRKRHHGSLLFIDLRDHHGLTQCVTTSTDACFAAMESVRPESVVSVTGRVTTRDPENINPDLSTGKIEVVVEQFEIDSPA